MDENIIARLVVRPTDPIKPLLILGVTFEGQEFLKGGNVYNLVEIDGVLILQHAGASCVPRYNNERGGNQDPNVCWGNSVGHILSCGRSCFLTTKEYELAKEAV